VMKAPEPASEPPLPPTPGPGHQAPENKAAC
jgi:hypothetical protein